MTGDYRSRILANNLSEHYRSRTINDLSTVDRFGNRNYIEFTRYIIEEGVYARGWRLFQKEQTVEDLDKLIEVTNRFAEEHGGKINPMSPEFRSALKNNGFKRKDKLIKAIAIFMYRNDRIYKNMRDELKSKGIKNKEKRLYAEIEKKRTEREATKNGNRQTMIHSQLDQPSAEESLPSISRRSSDSSFYSSKDELSTVGESLPSISRRSSDSSFYSSKDELSTVGESLPSISRRSSDSSFYSSKDELSTVGESLPKFEDRPSTSDVARNTNSLLNIIKSARLMAHDINTSSAIFSDKSMGKIVKEQLGIDH